MISRKLILVVASLISPLLPAQDNSGVVDHIVEVGTERLEEGATAQTGVDDINQTIEKLVADYTGVMNTVDDLDLYNRMLEKQIDGQVSEMTALKQSIVDAAVIERQIMPLLERMIDGLDQFIRLDLPFLREERMQRVERLRELMLRADFTLAEKTRRVFEAWQIENDYSRTIEPYQGQLSLNGETLDVEFLRVGRIALIYQDLSGKRVGNWNPVTADWQVLTGNQYRRHLAKGLKVSRQETAPELFTIPLSLPREVR